MSQVNKFNQLNNPDYVYFDLQQTNIYNTTTQEQQPLKFLETRETPVIKNTGDYYMSVARFQLDTYNLPVIVGEPDLTQTGTFDPDKTIYKVALTATNGSLLLNSSLTYYNKVAQITQSESTYLFGVRIKTADFDNNTSINVAVADPDFASQSGRIYLWRGTTTTNAINTNLVMSGTGNNTQLLGFNSLDMSNDGTRVVASSTTKGVYLWDAISSTTGTITSTSSYALIAGQAHRCAISGNGSWIWVARLTTTGGRARMMQYNSGTGTWTGRPEKGVELEGVNTLYEKGAGVSNDGSYYVTSAYAYDNNSGYVQFAYFNSGTGIYDYVGQFNGTAGERIGSLVAISGDATYGCALSSKVSDIGNYVRVYKRTGTTFSAVTTITGIDSVEWGTAMDMSQDGTTITVSAALNRTIYIYKRNTGLETFSLLKTIVNNTAGFGISVSVGKTGTTVFSTNSAGVSFMYASQTISAGALPIPSNISTNPTIESVKWIKDVEDVTAPTQNSLTGKNTALYPYYYCYSYNNFITMVNKTLKLAYKNLMEYIYNNWIVILGDAGITNQFLSISARQYPTPPFIDWNETNLTADVYVSMLFETYQTAANAVIANINYAMPETVWGAGGGNSVGVAVSNTPFKFELAFNAPLYSLFSSLPATKKVITNSTGKRELYYTLNFVSSGLGLVTPSPALNSIIPYSFLSTYTNASTGVVTIPTTGTDNYSHQKLLIKQGQEISTIDTWTPVNAIVFTTTSIPIIVNQFTASSSIGSNPPSSSLDNAFAFIITDLQSNQQGYRPNILLTPKIYRMIDLTGNQPLKNIDINVFWRTKTGNLIPFTLASGAMSSIKLLFQKKVLGENQQINMSSMTMRDII